VTQPLSDIDVSRRRLRVFLANRAIALGWALKGYCKPCAHRTIAKWLAPSVQRFLLHRTGSRNRNRRIFEFAVDLGTLLSRTYPGRVLAGFVIVVVFLGSLDLAVRATATHPQPLSLSGRPIPLPRRKPERVSKAQNGKGVKANTAIQKRMAQQKRVHAKPMR